jgi:hypothetical protein
MNRKRLVTIIVVGFVVSALALQAFWVNGETNGY